jgi:hypothetical protein
VRGLVSPSGGQYKSVEDVAESSLLMQLSFFFLNLNIVNFTSLCPSNCSCFQWLSRGGMLCKVEMWLSF